MPAHAYVLCYIRLAVLCGLLVDTSLYSALIKHLLGLNKLTKLTMQSCCNAIASEQVYQPKQPWYVVNTGSHRY